MLCTHSLTRHLLTHPSIKLAPWPSSLRVCDKVHGWVAYSMSLELTTSTSFLRSRISPSCWNTGYAWEVINPLAQLEESCDLAVLLALSNGNPRDSFDFFNVHIMTVAHALRVLWHYFPTSRRVSILKQYVLFGIMTYICQLRPQFSLD